MSRLYVGTSGYHYADWPGRFYPKDLPKDQWFAFYAREFDTVEINASFYRLPPRETFETWRRRAPRGFVHATKFSRYGTHMKRLIDAQSTIPRFLASAEGLGKTLGPILVQLPPRFTCNLERLDEFLRLAPRRRRWAIEFRDPSWLCEPVYAVLERHAAALVIHDLLESHPRRFTAGFSYQRFHGDNYGGHYSPQALAAEADRIAAQLEAGRDVYVYFNNDKQAAGVFDAQKLRRYVERRIG